MNLRDLSYLVAVAENLHFGKAAATCHISQPTLSMQLKKLEEEIGAQLFERTNKNVLLTPLGHDIVVQARRVLQEVGHMRQIARNGADPLTGDLRMGVFPTLAPYLLPSLVPKIKSTFPALNLLLVEDKTANLIKQLEDGQLDCALLAVPIDNDRFVAAKVFVEDFYLAVPAGHPLADRASIAPAELENLSLLLLDEGHCLRDQALMVCRAIGAGEAMKFRATSLETLRHMVAGGNAVTLIPHLAVRHDDPLVRYLPFKKPAPSRTIGLYWRRTSARAALYAMLSRHLALRPQKAVAKNRP
jgi:LysR family hydrogen peroxide-inducible transcriptional activator